MKYVILGNGAAGIMAAERLREFSSTDEIVMISREDTPVYSKCMLPDYAGGKLKREKLFIRDFNAYNQKNIHLILNRQAKAVNVKEKKITLEDNTAIGYDKLLIAVGGVPFIPPIEGIQKVEYHPVNSVEDTERIIEKAAQGRTAVVVGAGLSGIEMSFALRRHGVEVALIERETRVLPRQLDEQGSSTVIDIIQDHGIRFMLGEQVKSVREENGKKVVALASGEEIACDLLVMTIGTRPNIDLIKDSGIAYNRGILVNEYLQTSVEDVYAAGDVAETIDKLSNAYVSSYIWPNAMAQGKCAASNMAGRPEEFSSRSSMYNSVQLRDFPLLSMGMVNPQEECEIRVQKDAGKRIYRKVVIQDDVIKGLILIGDTTGQNALTAAIRKGTPVAELWEDIIKRFKNNESKKSLPNV